MVAMKSLRPRDRKVVATVPLTSESCTKAAGVFGVLALILAIVEAIDAKPRR